MVYQWPLQTQGHFLTASKIIIFKQSINFSGELIFLKYQIPALRWICLLSSKKGILTKPLLKKNHLREHTVSTNLTYYVKVKQLYSHKKTDLAFAFCLVSSM